MTPKPEMPKRDKYAKSLDTLQCVIDELADMIKRHNRQDPETGVWDYDYGGVAEAQKALGDLRSAFPPPAEDARQCAVRLQLLAQDKLVMHLGWLNEAAAEIESFARLRVEPWREALREAVDLLNASQDYWTQEDWDDVSRFGKMLSDSPAPSECDGCAGDNPICDDACRKPAPEAPKIKPFCDGRCVSDVDRWSLQPCDGYPGKFNKAERSATT